MPKDTNCGGDLVRMPSTLVLSGGHCPFFPALGALDSINKYFQMSLEAEERVNASTTDPNSTVEQSALIRERVEDLMMEQESRFREKQEEQARLLDELAGKLQSLDLSAAAEMVRFGGLASFL